MTHTQSHALAVATDQLREAGVDPADVVRALYDAAKAKAMLAGPEMLDALCLVALEFGRDMDIDEPREVYNFIGATLMAAHGLHVYDSQAHGQMVRAQVIHAGETHKDHCWARLAWGDGECECLGLSPAEIPAAASVHRPQKETPFCECPDPPSHRAHCPGPAPYVLPSKL